MTDAKVTITLVDPTLPEKRFVFDTARICVVGRETDCDISLPADFAHREVSRHHCLLDINPPHVRVRDLDSTNGTFVNGERLIAAEPAPEDTAEEGGSANLRDGDEVRLARTLLRVRVENDAEQLLAHQPSAKVAEAMWLLGN